ncbi:hypothetical protein D3C87_1917870 [compost metagenome]
MLHVFALALHLRLHRSVDLRNALPILLGIQRARPALAKHLVGETVLNAPEAILCLIDRVGQRSIIATQSQRVRLPADLQVARLAIVGNVQLRRA